jgi:hypothetical protein
MWLKPDQTVLTQSQQLLPEYQERFLKDLLANVYQTDPETGQVSGIAAISPLYGTPMMDEQGNPLFKTLEGGFTSDPTQAQTDQFGVPIEAVQGGVPRPDIIQFTDAQKQALLLGAQGIGLYEPMMEKAEATLGTGVGAFQRGISGDQPMLDAQGSPLFVTADGRFTADPSQASLDPSGQPMQAMQGGIGATTGAYDPTSYTSFYDPFVNEVITNVETDINRQADIERQRIGGAAVQAGAFGGSRQAVAEQELARNAAQQIADTSARLRSAAFTGAQQQAQSAFENQMARGQTAAQIFGQLGQGIGQLGVQQGALGEAAQGAAQRDVNALFNVGALEQAQRQAEYDVQRSGAIEEAYEPFQRFSYMSDIFRGVPSTSQTLASTSVPRPNPVASIFGTAQALSSMPGGMTGILGGLTRGGGGQTRGGGG